MLIKTIRNEIYRYLNEEIISNLVLYRGIELEDEKPDNDYFSFFTEDINFAKDYGDYIYKCYFNPMNIFVSYDLKYIEELYLNDYKLVDEYVEMRWEEFENDYNISKYYDNNKNNPFENGYKSAKDFIDMPFSGSDTWETIENSSGVLDYITSHYDGALILEGGIVNYYLNTSKMIRYELVS